MDKKRTIAEHNEIKLIIQRLAHQIAENHIDSDKIKLVGLNQRGKFVADSLYSELTNIISNSLFPVGHIDVEGNKVKIQSELSNTEKGAVIILVDDVLNSGKTAFVACSWIFEQGVAGLETVFLAERAHRVFPILANYVGITVATTIQDHVYFNNTSENNLELYLM
jgi:pyrimidine operon attenuation protein/uracil phosphoribosyltransferase